MYELTGKIQGLSVDFETGKANVSFEVNEKADIKRFFDELRNMGRLLIRVSKYRKKRSLNANAYAWKLMSEIAEAQGISSAEVYRHHIREAGVSRTVEISADAADTLTHSWGLHGLGWFTERLDSGMHKGFVLIKLYYGSSTYNTKQMSRLIENIVQDCRILGIQTKTPDEISNMLSLWKSESAA